MRILIIFFILIAPAAYINAFGGGVEDKVTKLEKEVEALRKKFYGNGQFPDANLRDTTDVESRLDYLEEKIRFLNGGVEEVQNSVQNLSTKMDTLKDDLDYKIIKIQDKMDLKQKSVIPTKTKKEDKKAKSNTKAEYKKAFDLLSASKFSAAETAFNAFIKKHGKHELVGNAYYWLGESFYVRKRFDKAAVNFLKSFKKFPSGNKASDSLYKLGMSLSNLNKKNEACQTFKQLRSRYPKVTSNIKKSIAVQKKKLGCI